MTRLTPEMISDVPNVGRLSYTLMRDLGVDLAEVACLAAEPFSKKLNFGSVHVGVVPITSGEGVISGFSDSVAAVIRHLGMDVFVTSKPDVTGFAEAVSRDAAVVFMADDEQFIAYNTLTSRYATNVECTARGYMAALEIAAGSLKSRSVLVVGCGRIGGMVAGMLSRMCPRVGVVDVVKEKALDLQERYANVHVYDSTEEAVRDNMIIFNASPSHIDSAWIQQGAVISSPGVPHTFDEEAYRRAKIIIHDPLAIGVSVMAVVAAGYSYDSEDGGDGLVSESERGVVHATGRSVL